MNKRYAIVMIDEGCPLSDINIGNINACKVSKSCQDCLYGDTKEQLINKVKTALQLCNKNRVEKCNQFYFVAKEIVEFLGVK